MGRNIVSKLRTALVTGLVSSIFLSCGTKDGIFLKVKPPKIMQLGSYSTIANALAPSVNHDGKRIAYIKTKVFGETEIYAFDIAQNEAWNVSNRKGLDFHPAIDSTGTKIIYVHRNRDTDELYFSDLEKKVTTFVDHDIHIRNAPYLSNDGEFVFYQKKTATEDSLAFCLRNLRDGSMLSLPEDNFLDGITYHGEGYNLWQGDSYTTGRFYKREALCSKKYFENYLKEIFFQNSNAVKGDVVFSRVEAEKTVLTYIANGDTLTYTSHPFTVYNSTFHGFNFLIDIAPIDRKGLGITNRKIFARLVDMKDGTKKDSTFPIPSIGIYNMHFSGNGESLFFHIVKYSGSNTFLVGFTKLENIPTVDNGN